MTVGDELLTALSEALSFRGFRRRGSNWYRKHDQIYTVVNVQKSRYSCARYINIGMCPNGSMGRDWIPESRCPIRFRLESLESIPPEDAALLDDISLIPDGERVETLKQRIAQPLASSIDRVQDESTLIKFIQSNVSPNIYLHREVRQRLFSS